MFAALAATTLTTAAAAGPGGSIPAPPFGPTSNGGWFGKEKKIAPAAGKKPHVTFILMDDYGVRMELLACNYLKVPAQLAFTCMHIA